MMAIKWKNSIFFPLLEILIFFWLFSVSLINKIYQFSLKNRSVLNYALLNEVYTCVLHRRNGY
jgi:hypothetical protein